MGKIFKKTKTKNHPGDTAEPSPAPELARRKLNKHSTIRLGRTIGEKRERLETANERAAARRKDKRKQTARVIVSSIFFIIILVAIVLVGVNFIAKINSEPIQVEEPITNNDFTPSIEIIDESSSNSEQKKITSRMYEFIGQVEADLKGLGYHPIKAILPANSIREVDFYLEGYSGFIKTITDRGAAVTSEDIDRMIRYLSGAGISDFIYIDVRIEGRAYWK